MTCGFGRRSPLRLDCQSGRLRRADEKVAGVMRRLSTVVAVVATCRVDSINILTKALLCQNSSCLPWQCLFGCSNERRSAIKQF